MWMNKTLVITNFILGSVMLLVVNTFAEDKSLKPKRVLLLGASVGQAWKIEDWPQRAQSKNYSFESVAVYDFDKSEALSEILLRPKRKFRPTRTYLKGLFLPPPQKPNIIIIKECAGYFPGNLEKYKGLIEKWIIVCKTAGIKPVLTTVVPVTREHARAKPGRLEGILAYNDWVREYTKKSGIGCLDLEVPLRVSGDDRVLRPDLTSGDGLHLNGNAYDILDNVLQQNSKQLFGS